MDGLVTFAAKFLLLVPLAAVGLIISKLSSRPRKHFLLLLVGTGLLSLVLAEIGRHLYYNPRPFLSDGVKPLFAASRDNGFPSDHTLLGGVLAFVSFSYSKRIGLTLVAVGVLIGWARVAAGVHHGIDVIGSLVISGVSYLAVKHLLKLNKKDYNVADERG